MPYFGSKYGLGDIYISVMVKAAGPRTYHQGQNSTNY